MCCEWLLTRELIIDSFKSFREVWIWPSIFWPRGILTFDLNSSLSSTSHSLFFHTSFNLFLNLILMVFDLFLNISNLLVKFIFFKFEKCLLFDCMKMFLLYFFYFFFVIFMKISHLFNTLSDANLLAIHSILMGSMEISLFS